VTPFLMAREYARQISFAHHAPWAALTLDLVAGAVQLALLYGLLGIIVGAPIAYLASGAGALFGVAAWWMFGIQQVRVTRSEVRGDWIENWQFGRWALVSQVTGNLAPLPWIVYAMWGAGETGAFDGANRIVGLSNILVMGYCNFLSAAAATAFAQEGSGALRRVILRAFTIFGLGLGGLCVAALIWGGDLLTLVMRGKIDNTGNIVAVLAFATLLDGLSQVALNGLRAMNRPADAVVADLVEVAMTLVSGITLIALFSAPGAAWAMVFGRLAGLLLRWRAYSRRIERASTPPFSTANSS
jgi:O-antigen/teichoic acid export membrane protein